MIKMFVSDIDGTLMRDGGYINPFDIEALRTLDKDGIILCFASGRLDNEIRAAMKNIDSHYHRISVNGVFIYTNKNEQLFSAAFEPKILHNLVDLTAEGSFIRYVSDEHHYYIEEKTPAVLELEKLAAMTSIEVPDLTNKLGDSIIPNKISIGGEPEDLEEMQIKLQQRFNGYVNTFISAKNCLDVVPANVNKGAAISVLLEKYHIQPHEFACVGDSYNDISMFELTPYSFVIERADETVKKRANYTVKSVKEAIEIVRRVNKIIP